MAPSALDTIAGNLAGGAFVGDCHHGVLPVAPILGSRDVDNGANTAYRRGGRSTRLCGTRIGSQARASVRASGLFVEGRLQMSGETFETLLAPNLQAVRRMVKSRLRTGDQTDDIVQQTLLHAFASRDQLRAESKFKSWLWSIALNEIRAFFRATRRS